ncbi:hypothetical protein GUJ93_ZPchr0004g39513 [Zizania palustris]|uniref:Uncharacterized protein n=1 Tax=Zizania palustris TaxID=103762 RepID=A0A8J5T193_ZIZPA|nr:hypothetical protein GUJ93_ZPchr0004g39513 [Zizania palustris]
MPQDREYGHRRASRPPDGAPPPPPGAARSRSGSARARASGGSPRRGRRSGRERLRRWRGRRRLQGVAARAGAWRHRRAGVAQCGWRLAEECALQPAVVRMWICGRELSLLVLGATGNAAEFRSGLADPDPFLLRPTTRKPLRLTCMWASLKPSNSTLLMSSNLFLKVCEKN